ncbi:MAG: dihydropteroate synthase [Armatimonadota bacterium]|nr:dihydropteroate synthase [Armatimonadota bacterium]MDR7438913.1 dihydropteroate synthase [Armatimonadota bacterium]MDR7562453.1 dihydropteroate synthase [Armatimonadota bacterium]MDR7567041.1 dihydropteroate synthase [Armatimonadota bacterium]MDR7601166.1 dihydropteroate synthase [Armatimonadota bacterium]
MVLIGELINATRKQVEPILRSRDQAALVELARRQVEAGTPILDVNCATLLEDEARCMEWAVRTIQGALEVRISLDSPNPEAIRRGLEVHRGRAVVNAINLERDRWHSLLPLLQEYRPEVVATCIDDAGVPRTAERKFEIAVRLVEGLLEAGVAAEDIYVDPLLLPVATDPNAGREFLRAVDLIRDRFPQVHLICGLSNVSFGLPHRALLNQVFFVLCLAHGMDAFILNPLDRRLMAHLLAAHALLGQDPYCRRYLAAAREGRLDLLRPPA